MENRGYSNNQRVSASDYWTTAGDSSSGDEASNFSNGDSKREKVISSRLIKNILIFLGIIIAIALISHSCKGIGESIITGNIEETVLPSEDYVAILNVNGLIADGEDDILSEGEYDHQWTMDKIDELMGDSYNVGLILSINSPGGSVFTSDELYFKIKEYQAETNRPVYASMQNMAASGGYYIAAPADMIYANRNAITGSIGITMGNHFDLSGLMERYGIKAEPLTSGPNKAMGDNTRPLTDEQRQIYASIISDAYEQFVDVVEDGRNMNRDEVLKLADGRIYTARQAVDNGLIDGIATLSEVSEKILDEKGVGDAIVIEVTYVEHSLWKDLMRGVSANMPRYSGDVEALINLVNKQSKMPVSYLCTDLI